VQPLKNVYLAQREVIDMYSTTEV